MDQPGRYWNVMLLDAYTHLSYIRRRDHGVDGTTGLGSTATAKDLMKRAAGTMSGLGGHEAIENPSYIARTVAAGDALDGDRPMQLRFGPDELPPCDGFWSLTANGPDLYLVENEIDRCSTVRWRIGNRAWTAP